MRALLKLIDFGDSILSLVLTPMLLGAAGCLMTQMTWISRFGGEVIDIDALVTEEILLAVPDHVLCQEICKGICPRCGADRNSADCGCQNENTDPRWAGLKELVNGK